jgi:hypothetical protein
MITASCRHGPSPPDPSPSALGEGGPLAAFATRISRTSYKEVTAAARPQGGLKEPEGIELPDGVGFHIVHSTSDLRPPTRSVSRLPSPVSRVGRTPDPALSTHGAALSFPLQGWRRTLSGVGFKDRTAHGTF